MIGTAAFYLRAWRQEAEIGKVTDGRAGLAKAPSPLANGQADQPAKRGEKRSATVTLDYKQRTAKITGRCARSAGSIAPATFHLAPPAGLSDCLPQHDAHEQTRTEQEQAGRFGHAGSGLRSKCGNRSKEAVVAGSVRFRSPAQEIDLRDRAVQ